jgi:hypothetical protein
MFVTLQKSRIEPAAHAAGNYTEEHNFQSNRHDAKTARKNIEHQLPMEPRAEGAVEDKNGLRPSFCRHPAVRVVPGLPASTAVQF